MRLWPASSVPARRLANGPISDSSPIEQSSARTPSFRWHRGPMVTLLSHAVPSMRTPSPSLVAPRIWTLGPITQSCAISACSEIYAVAGSTSVTPDCISLRLTAARISASIFASSSRELIPANSAGSVATHASTFSFLLRERGPKQGAIDDVAAGVDFPDGALGRRRVAKLDDFVHLVARIANHAA